MSLERKQQGLPEPSPLTMALFSSWVMTKASCCSTRFCSDGFDAVSFSDS
jgi:hypothetical protein